MDIDELSAWFEARGLEYLPRFEGIEAIFMQNREPNDKFGSAMAHIRLPVEAILTGDTYHLHPVITDSSFRIAEAIFQEEEANRVFLPFGVSGVSCDHSTTGSVWVKVTARQKAKSRVVDLQLFGETGERVATIEGLTMRPVPISSLKNSIAEFNTKSAAFTDLLYYPAWEEVELSEPTAEAGNWLLLPDNGYVSEPLFSALKEAGHKVHIATSAEAACEFLSSEKAHELNGVLHLWGMDLSAENPDASLLASLVVVQSCIENNVSVKNWFITKGAQAVVSHDAVSPWQSQFWGFGRTLQAENPGGFGGCIDLDPNGTKTLSGLKMLISELCCTSGETEIAFRQEARHIGYLAKPGPFKGLQPSLKLDPNASYLITGGLGSLGLQVAKYLATCGARHWF